MTDNTVETMLAALSAGWQGNSSPLVDEEWCWVTEARQPAPASYVSRDTGFCPPAASRPAHWWPRVLPVGGHETARRRPGAWRSVVM